MSCELWDCSNTISGGHFDELFTQILHCIALRVFDWWGLGMGFWTGQCLNGLEGVGERVHEELGTALVLI